jgi:hypothetical protein
VNQQVLQKKKRKKRQKAQENPIVAMPKQVTRYPKTEKEKQEESPRPIKTQIQNPSKLHALNA